MATIIFDFDGTIADSFGYVATFLEHHVRRSAGGLTMEETTTLRGMTMYQMADYFGSSKWQLPLLFVTGRRAMSKAIYNVPLFEGMGKVIEQLHAEGHELMIVSSNNKRNMRHFLRHHHLYKFFTDIYGDAGFFGKRRAIRTMLWRNHLKPAQALYIGDEARDVEAAKAAMVRVIAVSWGFDHAAVLAEHQPTAVANTPEDIIRILEEI
jgi:phosphoglycolate phosphatase